jgi:hypothetical protein
VEENYKPFYKEVGIVIVQAIINYLFEEALLEAWRRTRQRRGGTTLFSSVAWGPHEAHL